MQVGVEMSPPANNVWHLNSQGSSSTLIIVRPIQRTVGDTDLRQFSPVLHRCHQRFVGYNSLLLAHRLLGSPQQ